MDLICLQYESLPTQIYKSSRAITKVTSLSSS